MLSPFVFFQVGRLAQLLAAVAEDVRQSGQRLFLPAFHLGRVDAEKNLATAGVVQYLRNSL